MGERISLTEDYLRRQSVVMLEDVLTVRVRLFSLIGKLFDCYPAAGLHGTRKIALVVDTYIVIRRDSFKP